MVVVLAGRHFAAECLAESQDRHVLLEVDEEQVDQRDDFRATDQLLCQHFHHLNQIHAKAQHHQQGAGDRQVELESRAVSGVPCELLVDA